MPCREWMLCEGAFSALRGIPLATAVGRICIGLGADREGLMARSAGRDMPIMRDAAVSEPRHRIADM